MRSAAAAVLVGSGLVGLAACSLAVDLTGLSGGPPKDAGNAGDAFADASLEAPPGDGSGPSDTGATEAPMTGDGPALLFDDEFDEAALQPVWVVIAGAWSVQGGDAVETSGMGGGAIYVAGFSSSSDYEVVTRGRMTGAPAVADDALELIVRVSEGPGNYRFHCSWEPGDATYRLFIASGTQKIGGDLVALPIAGAFDPLGWFTLHARLTSNGLLACWIDELAGSMIQISITPSAPQMGDFGIADYNHATAFDFFRAYAAP